MTPWPRKGGKKLEWVKYIDVNYNERCTFRIGNSRNQRFLEILRN